MSRYFILRTVVLCLLITVVLVPAGASWATDRVGKYNPLPHQQDRLQIALMINTGSELTDGGFNESAWRALQIAQGQFGAHIEFVQPVDPEDTVNDLVALARGGTDIIVTVGFALAVQTTEVAPLYPDVWFIGVDQFQAETIDNLTGLIFPEDQSGFLAGVLAAGLSQSGVIGGVFGTNEVPPVVAFKEGYESGARWAADILGRELEILSTYHPGTAFDAFSDPDWGASTASVALEAGADVVFAAAGQTGNGALEEVAFVARSSATPLYCIGVDTDQWLTVRNAHPCLVSSATKLITGGVLELIGAYRAGTIQGGNYLGDVALASFHDFEDRIPAEVRDLIERAETGLHTGAIQTCYLLDLANWHGEGQPLKIGMVTDVGQVDDGSFNESTWNGVLALERCGAQADFIETQDTADYANNIAEFTEEGYDVIITVGYALADAALAAARAYPAIRFIGVDQFYDEPVPGVTGLVFHDDQAGFLAGFLAARLSQSGIIAAVLGTDQVPPVVAFNTGFENGARYANPNIQVISTFHPGGVDTSFTDPQWGAATARQALDQGADVVFGVGGQTGNGGLIEVAVAASNGNPPYCIGVDTDQWLTVPEAHPCLVSSAMKLMDGGIATLIVQYTRGTIPDGNYYGLVGLAPFHDFESSIPEELKAELDQLALDLAEGRITTGYSID